MKAYISYEGRTRVERYLFPRDALREVLLNAIVHRDYSTGVPMQIHVYGDQIRFGGIRFRGPAAFVFAASG